MRTSILATALLSAASTSAQLHELAVKAGLEYFGAATDTPGYRERAPYPQSYSQYDEILANPKEFGQTTPTNGQKWLFAEPEPRLFNFTEGDYVADLAERTGKKLRCHALVWHSQLAPWVETTEWTKETLTAAITRHIRGVAGYYKGKCLHWDVVNEALDEDGTYRKSVFYNVLGEDYIKLAFKVAAEVDPNAKLYYNDYGIERPASVKTAGALRLAKMIKDAGLRIDGVGMQAHLHADNHPSEADLIETTNKYAELVKEVAYTELDVRIKTPVDAAKLELQSQCYKKVVGACVKAKACVGITIWDFYDPFSWVPHVFPGNEASLLWFENFEKHPAYQGMVDYFGELIKGGHGSGPGKSCRAKVRKVRKA
ncbi:family 10 putative glycoside hydrolase [Podospora australis]|uniref:Beta-xylanase n=1 Tax=Podospora australis TaxID=1536484 RepID=A0AAN7ANE5_9PEZI|nr:family 10 putative glycoside hydrolase [Podospora australis]